MFGIRAEIDTSAPFESVSRFGGLGYWKPSQLKHSEPKLRSEAEQFKRMGEATRVEVMKAISEIEQTKTAIKTVEIRLFAAPKMKEAARAAEAVALAEIKALSNSENSPNSEALTLSSEEYSSLSCKAQDAEELSKSTVVDAMLQVEDANVSKMEILKKVEEAAKEVKTTKKVLEEALNRVEVADREKLRAEESLCKWRSDHGQKRRSSVHNSTKFKNSYPSHLRRDPRLLEVNGMNLASEGPDVSDPVLKPTLSIGQILSNKLLVAEEFERRHRDEKGLVRPNSQKTKWQLGHFFECQNSSREIHCRSCTFAWDAKINYQRSGPNLYKFW